MSYIKAVYMDLNECCDDFVKGIELLEQSSIHDASNFFQRACHSVSGEHRLFSKYHSYYGFSCLLSGKSEAIDFCRHAVQKMPFDGDICMNLARAEIFLNNRLEALSVIKTGLQYSSNHGGLQTLQSNLGLRKRKPLPFLSRNNPISIALGKRMRKMR
ncbi:MAG: hypothetical protein OQK46_08480 [Gammaproteobacteria bacterium]|nr:hypothetical protein [Gammaproteobacteria bacterium]